MAHDPENINELNRQLSDLLKRQEQLQADLRAMQQQIRSLSEDKEVPPMPVPKGDVPATEKTKSPSPTLQSAAPERKETLIDRLRSADGRSNLEKFIGENLISKIGILITVFGVAFGAKYAIDHDLISPLVRIILGYLAGGALVFLAMRLRAAYTAFSAVLLSGGLAIWYIITYFAYAYYQLIPQILAFGMMVLFTAFTVLAALRYDRQVIALFGLVGAYAVPFLLGDESGSTTVLFSYILLINIGLLLIAFRKDWRLVNRSAFWFTWLIYAWWWLSSYRYSEQFATAMTFLSLFFLTFYLTFIAYKLVRKEPFRNADIIYMLANSFFFYGIGYDLIDGQSGGQTWLGPFTLMNAAAHFAVGLIIYRQRLADRRLFHFVIGLVLVFVTIAVPVQLDGSWVTLLWAGEAVLLYWLARSRNVLAFERMALVLIGLTLISLMEDWSDAYQAYYSELGSTFAPLLNIHFLNSLVVVTAFGIINWLRHSSRYEQPEQAGGILQRITYFALPVILIITLYFTFLLEIEYYWEQRYLNSEVLLSPGDPTLAPLTSRNATWYHLRTIWAVLYSMFFVTALSWINLLWLRNRLFAWINVGLNLVALLVFLLAVLLGLSDIREYYLSFQQESIGISAAFVWGMRYISYLFVAALLYTTYRYFKSELINVQTRWPFDMILHLTILWAASSELLHWMDFYSSSQSYKLGLSIFWGIYALLLIILGLAQRKAYLRVGAIVLFAVTLLKLFFYDIAHLNTISKTVVLISLGLLLLVISFLYNKFKYLITDEKI